MKRLVLTLAFMALVAPLAQMAPADNWYVATNGTGGGTSWADATNSIQGAIDASAAADTVWVSNGVYEAGGVTNFPSGTVLTNRVAIYKAITVRSADNDPTNTIIKGAWDPVTTNGPAAVRCVWMTNGSTLIGFTLTNGATRATTTADGFSGGALCQSTNTTISNCVLTGNSAYYGGGAMYGTLFNCTLSGNSATYGYGGGEYGGTLFNCTLSGNLSGYQGGGAYNATLFNCTLISNSTADIPGTAEGGGGAYGGILSNCTLIGNSAPNGSGGGARAGTLFNCTLTSNGPSYYGGGAYSCTLSNCTLTGNSGVYGGGAYYGTLFNCTLTRNSANTGGGAQSATLYNCTIVSNSAGGSGGNGTFGGTLYNCTLIGNFGGYGGGARASTLYNCTIVGNSGESGGTYDATLYNCITWGNSTPDYISVGTWYYSCGAGLTNGGSVSGNITNDPLFITNGSGYGTNHVAGNYRLRGSSPPLNAGTNFSWMTDPADVRSKDLDGQRRINGNQVDMGCYEFMRSGTMFTIQ